MINKIEKLIVDWLKSDNENATYLADQIYFLFDVNYRLNIGDYVFVTKYSDGDPNDPWFVSTLKEIKINNNGWRFKVDGTERWWNHIKLITKEEGEEILRTYPKLEF